MTVDEYLPWAMAQTSGRYELVQGEVVAQAAERAAHNLGKAAIYRALRDAVKKAGLPCTVFTDGMAVKIDQHTVREPDASVQCEMTIDPNAIVLETPVIVVEVISPSSIRDDSGAKLAEYFSVPSIQHYLILDPFRPVLIHHARGEAGAIATRIHTDGVISLAPPGLDLDVADVLTSG
ncbi:MAG: Uma2 family endonuclease [Hyphomicrobium sp.]